jgi:hypothetical protein
VPAARSAPPEPDLPGRTGFRHAASAGPPAPRNPTGAAVLRSDTPFEESGAGPVALPGTAASTIGGVWARSFQRAVVGTRAYEFVEVTFELRPPRTGEAVAGSGAVRLVRRVRHILCLDPGDPVGTRLGIEETQTSVALPPVDAAFAQRACAAFDPDDLAPWTLDESGRTGPA